MGRGHNVGPRRVHLRMDRERGPVHRGLSLHYLAKMVHQDEVGYADLPEVLAKWVDPKMVGTLRIAGGDVPCHAFVETESGEQAKGASQLLFPMLPLLRGVGENGRLRRLKRRRV